MFCLSFLHNFTIHIWWWIWVALHCTGRRVLNDNTRTETKGPSDGIVSLATLTFWIWCSHKYLVTAFVILEIVSIPRGWPAIGKACYLVEMVESGDETCKTLSFPFIWFTYMNCMTILSIISWWSLCSTFHCYSFQNFNIILILKKNTFSFSFFVFQFNQGVIPEWLVFGLCLLWTCRHMYIDNQRKTKIKKLNQFSSKTVLQWAQSQIWVKVLVPSKTTCCFFMVSCLELVQEREFNVSASIVLLNDR